MARGFRQRFMADVGPPHGPERGTRARCHAPVAPRGGPGVIVLPREHILSDTDVAPDGQKLHTAFVGNLWFKTTRTEVARIFANYRVVDIRMLMDRSTGTFRGFCYVDFASAAELTDALALDGVLVPAGTGERALRVHVANGRRGQQRSQSVGENGSPRMNDLRWTRPHKHPRVRHDSGGGDGVVEASHRDVFEQPPSPGSPGRRHHATGPKMGLNRSRGSPPVRGGTIDSRCDDPTPRDVVEQSSGSTGNPALDMALSKGRRIRTLSGSSGGDPSKWEPTEESRAMRPKLRLAKRSVSDDPGGIDDSALSTIFGSPQKVPTTGRHPTMHGMTSPGARAGAC